MIDAILIGAGATAFLDLWSAARARFFASPQPDYGLVGRWLAHLARGQFFHTAIAKSAPVAGERVIGWTAHYLIGIAFAALLLRLWGVAWLQQPTLGPALIVGVATVAAPLLILQPGMGAGIAASRTPHPVAACFQSLLMHTAFGLGLYLAGWATKLLLL